ncbi:MAG: TIGR03067 domain-containing protein [Gemmataceae bacterium]|nr:TIGR03067 domain-containing protein [Gemmata sp.]MDW8196867.1 TIGR03067 domain-containing protein [Gemmataceae bacterium]
MFCRRKPLVPIGAEHPCLTLSGVPWLRGIAGAILVAGMAGMAPAAPDPHDAAKQLEGQYEVVQILINGQPDKKRDEVESFVIKDGEMRVRIKNRTGSEDALFVLDPSKKPSHIDIRPKDAGAKETKILGIYQVKETDDGTELTIAFAREGGERPQDFKGKGEGHVVLILLRRKAK